MLVVTRSPFRAPQKQYEGYAGSTASTIADPVVMDDPSELWKLAWPAKKAVCGDTNLVAMGGPQPGAYELEVKLEPRAKDSVEPVIDHYLREGVYSELLQAFPIGAISDLTPGEGCLARAPHQLNIVYAGVVSNEAHEAGMRTHVEGL